MLQIYDKKYGKHGKIVIRRLKRKLKKANAIIKQRDQEIKDLNRQIVDLEKLLAKARKVTDPPPDSIIPDRP